MDTCMSRSFCNDEFADDDELFSEGNSLNKFTYVCEDCECGIVRVSKNGKNPAYWICINSACGTAYRDGNGKPVGNPCYIQDDNDGDPFR